jgi:hypothetical protein
MTASSEPSPRVLRLRHRCAADTRVTRVLMSSAELVLPSVPSTFQVSAVFV